MINSFIAVYEFGTTIDLLRILGIIGIAKSIAMIVVVLIAILFILSPELFIAFSLELSDELVFLFDTTNPINEKIIYASITYNITMHISKSLAGPPLF